MNYSVDWAPAARSHLAAAWVQYVPHRASITAAQARIDRLLAADPLKNGSPVSEGLYAIDVPPQRAVYEVSTADRRVIVVSINWLP
jgi:hypothetical protein